MGSWRSDMAVHDCLGGFFDRSYDQLGDLKLSGYAECLKSMIRIKKHKNIKNEIYKKPTRMYE